jgi:hypothetical protein
MIPGFFWSVVPDRFQGLRALLWVLRGPCFSSDVGNHLPILERSYGSESGDLLQGIP